MDIRPLKVTVREVVAGYEDNSDREEGIHHARTFSQLLPKEKERILDYQLLVYVCEGADTDRLRWFETINIAGERLSGQEIRNAQYSGPWVTDLKRYFFRTNSPAQHLAASKPQIYITLPASNTWNRQGGLEKALRWFIGDLRDTEKLEAFMSAHKEDADAASVWQYFQDVIAWTKRLFPTYRKGMEKVEWGILYNQYHEREFDLDAIQRRVAELYADDEVKDKSGIYEYIFDGRQSHLNLRQFEDWQKQTMYERQKGRCPECVKETGGGLGEAALPSITGRARSPSAPPRHERHAYKIVITEVGDENGDGTVDIADVEYLIKNRKNVLTRLKGNGDFRPYSRIIIRRKR